MIQTNKKMDLILKKQIDAHQSKLSQQKREIEAWRRGEAYTPSSLAAGKLPVFPGPGPLEAYFERVEKVRNIKRQLLADKASLNEEDSN